MGSINDWHDILRTLAFFVSIYCVIVLAIHYKRDGRNWNVKTKDYWFALMMWSLAGCVFAGQGVVLDRPFTPGFVFLTAAVLVTGKGLARKGPWGSDEA